MNTIRMNDLEAWFQGYVSSFGLHDHDERAACSLKAEHTTRVVAEIGYLAQCLNLPPEECFLAGVCALFHDIGRFEQYRRWHTFVDAVSVDHGEYGVAILQQERVLDEFDPMVRDLVCRIIRYHNRARLPADEDERCLRLARLLRDADKLDIYRVVTDYYRSNDTTRNPALELGLPDTPAISSGVLDDLMAARIVDISNLKTLNDFKLLQAGWIYDINTIPALERVLERNYLDYIQQALPQTGQVQSIFIRIHDDVARLLQADAAMLSK